MISPNIGPLKGGEFWAAMICNGYGAQAQGCFYLKGQKHPLAMTTLRGVFTSKTPLS